MSISAEQGVFLWKSLKQIETITDEALLNKLAGIKRVFLNWHTAPDDYINEHLDAIIPMALNDWMVDRKTGRPTRPQSKNARDFADKFGLTVYGVPTSLVTGMSPAASPFPRAVAINNR